MSSRLRDVADEHVPARLQVPGIPLRPLAHVDHRSRLTARELGDELVRGHRRVRRDLAARRAPGVEPSREVPLDALVPDPEQLRGGLDERGAVGNHERERGAERHEPSHVAPERLLQRHVQGPGHVGLGERGALARVHQRDAGRHHGGDLVGRSSGRERDLAEHRGSRPVDRRHVRVVRGVLRQPRQLLAHERRLVGGDQRRVAEPLLADRRRASLAGRRRRAEAPGAVRRQQGDAIGQGGEPSHRRELQPGELVGAVRAEQVRPPGAPDDQAAAREQRRRLVGSALPNDVGGVLERVSRRRERDQRRVADRDLVAVVAPGGTRTRTRPRPGRRSPPRWRPAARPRRRRSRCARASRRRTGSSRRSRRRARSRGPRPAGDRRPPPRRRRSAGSCCRRAPP